MFRRIGGRTPASNERPAFWENPIPLRRPASSDDHTIEGPDFQTGIRDAFPQFDAVEIYVEDLVDSSAPATARVYLPDLGFVGDLGSAERLICDASLALPSIDDPLFDLDQGYDIYFCSDETHAYYVAGAWDDPASSDFMTYWRTPLAALARAWTTERERCLVAFAEGDPALRYPQLRWFFGTGGSRGRAPLLGYVASALTDELADLARLSPGDAVAAMRAIGGDIERERAGDRDPVARLRRAVSDRKRVTST